MTTWDEIVALLVFAAAVVAVARRAYCLFATSDAAGCAAACGSCPAAGAPPARSGALLLIEPAPSTYDAKR